MSVEFRDLRWAVSAAQHRSLRQAAEALGIRQSTLSRRLRALEERVGGALFERSNGGTRLSLAGYEFIEFARQVLEDTDTALRVLRTRSRGENGRLTIGVYASLATGNLHATLADYHRRFPEVHLHLVDGSHARLFGALGRNIVDVAVMTHSPHAWGDRELPLWSERIIVALPEGDPLARQPTLRWRDLANQRIVLPLHGPGPELEGLLAAKLNGDRPKHVLHQECALDRLLSLVSMGHGLLLMFEGGSGLKHDGVIYRELQDGHDPARLSFTAYWQQRNDNPTLEPFLRMLRERYPDLSSTERT